VGVNLHDLPPLGSLHRRDLGADKLKEWEQTVAAGAAAEARGELTNALVSYEAAARLDDHFAELLFRMARCYEATGKSDEARRHFVLARDQDTIQFRTDSRLNHATRSIATNSGTRIHLADQERQIAASVLARHGVPGADIFQEHVHFKFEGDHLMAESLLPRVAAVLKLPAPPRPALSRDECAQRLAYTSIDDFNVRSAIVRMTGHAPFLDQLDHAARQAVAERALQDIAQKATTEDFRKAALIYQQALAARPDDWMIHFNFGNLLKQMGQGPAAVAHYEQAVSKLPNQRAYRMNYGSLLLELGRAQDAVEQFAAVVKMDPNLSAAKQALAAARARARR
jgi:tetratricopeptide (TPR) repeat protein